MATTFDEDFTNLSAGSESVLSYGPRSCGFTGTRTCLSSQLGPVNQRRPETPPGHEPGSAQAGILFSSQHVLIVMFAYDVPGRATSAGNHPHSTIWPENHKQTSKQPSVNHKSYELQS